MIAYILFRVGIVVALCLLFGWACTRAMNPKRKS